MIKTTGWILLPVMFLALGALAQAKGWSKEQVCRAGYEQGYRDGVARMRHAPRVGSMSAVDPRIYRDDAGYAHWMGHKGEYKKAYREGFRAGYFENAYGGSARRGPLYGSRYSSGFWGGSGYRYYDRGLYGYGLAYEMGTDRGYNERLKKGREDYRKNRDYNPARHGKYRDADDGYKSSYGSRRDFEAGYRRGFEDGYHQAYRP